LPVVLTGAAGIGSTHWIRGVITAGVALPTSAVTELAASIDAFVSIAQLGHTFRVVATRHAAESGAADGLCRVFDAAGMGGWITLSTPSADTLAAVSTVDALAFEIAQTAPTGQAFAVTHRVCSACITATIVTGIAGATEAEIGLLAHADFARHRVIVSAVLVVATGSTGVEYADRRLGEGVAALVIGAVAFLAQTGYALVAVAGAANALEVDVAGVTNTISTEGGPSAFVAPVVITRVAAFADAQYAL